MKKNLKCVFFVNSILLLLTMFFFPLKKDIEIFRIYSKRSGPFILLPLVLLVYTTFSLAEKKLLQNLKSIELLHYFKMTVFMTLLHFLSFLIENICREDIYTHRPLY